jgi:flagellar hook-length control protein FliK
VTAPAGPALQVRPAVAELARGLRDAGGGRASLVVRLDPPELGPVLVRLTVHNGSVDVSLRATEAAAGTGLLSATSSVRDTLREHGLDLSSFDVQTGGGDAGAAGDGDRSGSAPDRGTGRRGRPADVPTGSPTARRTPTPDGADAGTWL